MDVIGTKVLAGFLLFFIAMFFGMIPTCLFNLLTNKTRSRKTIRNNKKSMPFIQYLHSMASGVLIATCILHLLPESLKTVRDALSSGNASSYATDPARNKDSSIRYEHYPIAEFLVAIGFLFLYITDSIIKSLQSVWSKQKFGYNKLNTEEDVVLFQHPGHISGESEFAKVKDSVTEGLVSGHQQRHLPHRPRASEVTASVEIIQGDTKDQSDGDSVETYSSSEADRVLLNWPAAETQSTGLKKVLKSTQVRSIALVAALCIHGFFDGVMLGLQTNQPVTSSLLLALALHKSFVAIGLSLTLVSNSNNSYTLVYIFTFASVAPLGLLLSALFVHKTFDMSGEQLGSLVPGLLQAFAVGTFMYVSFTEATERHHFRSFKSAILHHLFLLTGFAFMAGIRGVISTT